VSAFYEILKACQAQVEITRRAVEFAAIARAQGSPVMLECSNTVECGKVPLSRVAPDKTCDRCGAPLKPVVDEAVDNAAKIHRDAERDKHDKSRGQKVPVRIDEADRRETGGRLDGERLTTTKNQFPGSTVRLDGQVFKSRSRGGPRVF
jgi:hypothetical protein